MGGIYERMIDLLKISLYRSIRENPYCGPVQFRTIIAEIEAAINTRPITYIESSADLQPLSPNHFLKIEYISFDSEHPIPYTDSNARKVLIDIAKRMDEKLNQFWQMWKTGYLQILRDRPAEQRFQNKNTARKDPEIGDVVIIPKKHTERGAWSLGKIKYLIPSESDGQV